MDEAFWGSFDLPVSVILPLSQAPVIPQQKLQGQPACPPRFLIDICYFESVRGVKHPLWSILGTNLT